MSKPWFKAPSDLMQDYRFFGLSVADQRHYFCLLMAKSSGLLDQDFERSDAEFAHAAREALIANFLSVSKLRAGKIKHALLLAGLIDDEWQPLDWDDRYGPGAYRTAVEQQDTEKSGAERQRKYRERKKSTVTDERNGVTGSVTDERNVFPLSYEEEEGRIKKTDTDTDGTAYTTGPSPVVPRVQAHATPSAAPPVETEEKPEGLAEQPIAEPKKTEPVLEAVPAKPDKPPNATRKKSELAQRLLSVDDVIAKGAERQYALDWMAVRKAKGCGLTASELEANEREATKAGISFGQAVQTCAENGWRGFKENYWRNLQARNLPAVRASPYPENLPDGVIPLVRSATMQSSEMARQLIFNEHVPHEQMGKSNAEI